MAWFVISFLQVNSKFWAHWFNAYNLNGETSYVHTPKEEFLSKATFGELNTVEEINDYIDKHDIKFNEDAAPKEIKDLLKEIRKKTT